MKMWKSFSVVAVCSTLALSACVTDPTGAKLDSIVGGAKFCPD